jgi:hypothetical protein
VAVDSVAAPVAPAAIVAKPTIAASARATRVIL